VGLCTTFVFFFVGVAWGNEGKKQLERESPRPPSIMVRLSIGFLPAMKKKKKEKGKEIAVV